MWHTITFMLLLIFNYKAQYNQVTNFVTSIKIVLIQNM